MRPARTAFALAVLCLPVWACVPPDVAAVRDGPAPSTTACGADRLAGYIGKPVISLPASGPWRTLRVIRPGTAVTMDYSATRLNARVNSAGRILALTCG